MSISKEMMFRTDVIVRSFRNPIFNNLLKFWLDNTDKKIDFDDYEQEYIDQTNIQRHALMMDSAEEILTLIDEKGDSATKQIETLIKEEINNNPIVFGEVNIETFYQIYKRHRFGDTMFFAIINGSFDQ